MSENTFGVYDDVAARLEAAFQGFARSYEVMYPPPQKPKDTNWRGYIGAKQVGMILALIGSIIVSASHTIPVFLGINSIQSVQWNTELVVALAVFVMVELGIVSFAYSATEGEANQDTARRVRQFTRGGMWFIVIIAVLANVYYVLSANIAIPSMGAGAYAWSIVRLSIFLLIGASAPVVAFLTGDILAIDSLKHRARSRNLLEVYRQDYEDWRSSLINSWNAQKKKWGGQVNISVQPEHSLNRANEQYSLPHSVNHSVNGANEQAYSANTGYSKKMNARDIISSWFDDNPDYVDSDDTVDDVHQLIMADTGQKVGRTSVYNVRKELVEVS